MKKLIALISLSVLCVICFCGIRSAAAITDATGDNIGAVDLTEARAEVYTDSAGNIDLLKLYLKATPRLPGIVVFEADVDNSTGTGGANSILGSPVSPCPCKSVPGMDVSVTIFLREQPDNSMTAFCASCSDVGGACGHGRKLGEWMAIASIGGQPIRMLGNIRGMLRPLPQLPIPPYPTEECITLPWYHIIGFVLGDNPNAFNFSKAIVPANQKWQVSLWYDETYTFENIKDDFSDGPVGPFDVSDWAPNAGKADMEVAGAATYCEGNFDGDKDVDGTDAAKFKSDFGRSSVKNPCPDCGPF